MLNLTIKHDHSHSNISRTQSSIPVQRYVKPLPLVIAAIALIIIVPVVVASSVLLAETFHNLSLCPNQFGALSHWSLLIVATIVVFILLVSFLVGFLFLTWYDLEITLALKML